jgi:hypothetical protein
VGSRWGGNRVLIVTINGHGQLAKAPELSVVLRDETPEPGVTVRNTCYGARVEVVDSENYENARKLWGAQHNGQTRQILGHIGGEPSWIQGDQTPTCDNCGSNMIFVAQLEEGPDRATEMNFGGAGCAYVFRCSCGQPSGKFLWQCG